MTDEQYERAKLIWKKLDCKTMRDYHNFYLKMDVLLLTDVFQNFRKLSIQHFGLDPAHFYTLPGFAWTSCLKKTEQELEAIEDYDMYLFIENSMRGGISMISNRHVEANNEYMETGYDDQKKKSYITYLDCNSLYGTVMSENKFPVNQFRFWSEDEINDKYDVFRLSKIDKDSDTGYILEVDLEYPPELHDLHNDYPLAPEKLTVTDEMLGPYARTFPDRPKPTEKLVPNLQNKTKYVLHYENLKLYLKHGLRLTKIHRVLEFRQKAWLKEYVDFCIEMRKQATTDFEKDFWKLCVNAVFGKSMENVRNRVNVRLGFNYNTVVKVVANPNYITSRIINDNLIMNHMARQRILLNKPIYTGFCILELSKVLMYKFHYEYIKKKYDKDRAKLLFTDTDSLCYHIETDDLYRDMLEDSDRFDTSNFNAEDPNLILRSLFSKKNQKVLGEIQV